MCFEHGDDWKKPSPGRTLALVKGELVWIATPVDP